jgi:hypothetical protein
MPDSHVNIDGATAAWLEAARAAKTEIARLTEIYDTAIQHVKDTLGDAEEARLNGKPVATWTWSKPGQRLDRKKLEGDFGKDVIDAYLIDNTPARPFRILDQP